MEGFITEELIDSYFSFRHKRLVTSTRNKYKRNMEQILVEKYPVKITSKTAIKSSVATSSVSCEQEFNVSGTISVSINGE
jgi:hypothetical protein